METINVLEKIRQGSSGLFFPPGGKTLPNIHEKNLKLRRAARATILEGEANLRRDGRRIRLDRRLGLKPIIALTGPSGGGKTTFAELLKGHFQENCRLIRAYTTRAMRSGEADSSILSFLTRDQLSQIVEDDAATLPRKICQLAYYANEVYLAKYSQLIWALEANDLTILVSNLDRAINLKRNGLYGMHICYLSNRETMTPNRKRSVHQEYVRAKLPSTLERNDLEARLTHSVMTNGLVRAALIGQAPLTIDSVLCFRWNQIDWATGQLLDLIKGLSDQRTNSYHAEEFLSPARLQDSIVALVNRKESKIERMVRSESPNMASNLLSAISLIDTPLPMMPNYSVHGPGSPRPFPLLW